MIEVYIYEVTRRLPEKTREDIALELNSTIGDMLPDNHSEEDVKHVLTKLGSPTQLATKYKDKPNYLIGPDIYDIYSSTIKLVIPWAIGITLLVHLIESIFIINSAEPLLSTIIELLATILVNSISVVLQVLFWITLTFILVERTGSLQVKLKQTAWTPDDLKKVRIIPKEIDIPLSEILFSIIGIAFLAIGYFYADRIAGVYQTAENGKLSFVLPIFNQETLLTYSPVIIFLLMIQLALLFYKFRLRKWTNALAIANLVVGVITTIIVIVIAKNVNLLNVESINYVATKLAMTPLKVAMFSNNIIMVTILILVITTIFDIYSGFRKAKL